jgi:hypothetical protein
MLHFLGGCIYLYGHAVVEGTKTLTYL